MSSMHASFHPLTEHVSSGIDIAGYFYSACWTILPFLRDNEQRFTSADDLAEGEEHEETIIEQEDIRIENVAVKGLRSAALLAGD